MRPEAHTTRQTGLPYLRIIPAVILGYAKRISHFRIGWKGGQGDGGKRKRERERRKKGGKEEERTLTYIHPPNPLLMIKDPRLLAAPRHRHHTARGFFYGCRASRRGGNTETIRGHFRRAAIHVFRGGYLGGREPVELT